MSGSLLLLVEGVMTNGSGMVQFSRGFMRFGRKLPIVPVALRISVPWNIQTHTLTSTFAANLFWFCFVPWVKLDATVLKPMSLAEVRLLKCITHQMRDTAHKCEHFNISTSTNTTTTTSLK